MTFDWSVVTGNLPLLLQGAGVTVALTLITMVLAVPELMRQSQILAGKTYRPFEIYTVAMLVYFCLCYPVARGVDAVYRRLAPLGSS